MKLSKIQAEALASKIQRELNRDVLFFNNELKKSKEYLDFSKKDKISSSLIKLFPDCMSSQSGDNYCAFQIIRNRRDAIFTKKFKKEVSSMDIYNELVIRSIEAENIEQIIESIKLKFQ